MYSIDFTSLQLHASHRALSGRAQLPSPEEMSAEAHQYLEGLQQAGISLRCVSANYFSRNLLSSLSSTLVACLDQIAPSVRGRMHVCASVDLNAFIDKGIKPMEI
eukprot:644597-Pelagomonas_calceolata.AAC.9